MIEYMGVAVPKTVVDRSGVDEHDLRRFEASTGIKKTRRYHGASTTLMITEAIEALEYHPYGIDTVLVVTQSPDAFSPCMAARIHDYLGLSPRVLALDLNHACDAWVVALQIAEYLTGKTLIICADRLRYGHTPMDRLIFSDSVSLTIARRGVDCGASFFTDGGEFDKLYCGLNGVMHMDGNFIFDFVTSKVPELIKAYPYQGDFLVPHQANLSMLKVLEMRSGYKDRTLYSIEEYGNLSMNSIPMTIHHNEEKILGKRILTCGFGAGITVATKAIDWSSGMITKMAEF